MNPKNPVECIAPFSSLYIPNLQNSKPCCIIKGHNDKKIDLYKSLDWNFNHINQTVREEFLSFENDFGKYKDCDACYIPLDTENASSQMDMHNSEMVEGINYINNPTITNLHLKFSNLCNLACRMCDPFSSNLLFKDSNYKTYSIPIESKVDSNYVIQNIPKDTVLYKSIIDNLQKLNRLWFSGGETLLHDEVWEILRHLYDIGHSKNVTLQLNTNGTVKLTEEEIAILKSFKRLILHISIDGVGQLAEYIRTNLNWNSWSENYKIYHENFKKNDNDFCLVVTISTFNIHRLLEIHDYFNKTLRYNINYNFVYGPLEEVTAFNINQKAKNYLLNLYKDSFIYSRIENFLKNEPRINSSTVTELIDSRDRYNIENKIYKNYKAFKDVEPEWYNILCS